MRLVLERVPIHAKAAISPCPLCFVPLALEDPVLVVEGHEPARTEDGLSQPLESERQQDEHPRQRRERERERERHVEKLSWREDEG